MLKSEPIERIYLQTQSQDAPITAIRHTTALYDTEYREQRHDERGQQEYSAFTHTGEKKSSFRGIRKSKQWPLLLFAAVGLLLAALPSLADAQSVVSVDLSQPTGQTVVPEIFGLSTSMGDASHDYLNYSDPNFYDLADQYPMPLLRHNWELNTFMDILFPSRGSSPNFAYLDNYLNSHGDFIGFFNNSKDRQIVTLGFPSWLDISSSSDQTLYGQMVVEVAQHFAERGMPVHWFELVNESDGTYDAQDEALTFNALAEALHAYDPTIKVGGLTDSYMQPDRLATFFQTSGANIGFISWHQYITNGTDGKTDQQCVDDGLSLVESDAAAVRSQATQAGIPTNVPLFLGEYNVDGGVYTDPKNGNLTGAVYAGAVTYGMIASNTNMTMGALWETANDGTYSIFGQSPNYSINSVGVTLFALGQYMPGSLVQTTMPSNTPGLVGYATTNPNGYSLALINTNLSNSYTVDLSHNGFGSNLTRLEISNAYPQGNSTTVSNLANVSVPAGSIVIVNSGGPSGWSYSPNGATIPSATQIVDFNGGIWTVAGGVVYLNGSPAGYSANVTQLVYSNGVVFQENNTGGWWSWNGSAWNDATQPIIASPDNTTIPSASRIVDSNGGVWTVAGGVIYLNGSPAGTSANVVQLAYLGGVIFQENNAGGWWSWNGSSWNNAAQPVIASLDNTTIPSASQIVDSSGGAWTVAGGVVYLNGSAAGYSANVVQLVYSRGLIFQENNVGGWWSWNGTTWINASAPAGH